MQLGISTLGHLIDFAIANKFNDMFKNFYEATETCLNFAEENDINVVEIVIEPQDLLREDSKHKFFNLIRSYSIKKQVHGPYIDISLCSHNSTISLASIEAYIETYKICKELSINLMTIHPGVANSMIKSLREYNKIQLVKALNNLIDSINDQNFIVALENMPKDTFIMLDHNNIIDIFKSVNRNDLFMTFDTSHYYTNTGDVNLLWKEIYNVIKNVHLVDNYTKEADPHPPLGSGKIDFKRILNTIKNYNYKGSLIIELSSAKGLKQSIEYIKAFI
jgi:sugar phosphate isomerase/epimerase